MSILALIEGKKPEELGPTVKDSLDEFVKDKIEETINDLLQGEIEDFLTDALRNQTFDIRNGYYKRHLKTKYGRIEASVPRDRINLFETKTIQPYKQTAADLECVIQSPYLGGLSQNEIVKYLDEATGIGLSREAIRATNCIESFNASLRRRPSHRVLFSSESNEMIILAARIADYDNAASKKKEKYIAESTEEERHRLGFGIIARADGKIMVLIIQTQNFLQLSSVPKSRHIKKMAATNKIGAIEDRFDITFSANPADKQAMTFSIQ